MINTKIALSTMSIVASLALLGGAAFAAFSSSNSNANNSFTAGTLTLSINTQTVTSTGVFNVSGLGPGESTPVETLALKNEGSVDASGISVTSINVTPTPASPNLGDKLILTLWQDTNNDHSLDAGDTIVGQAPLTNSGWNNHSLGFGLTAGTEQDLFA